jgi:hypothetical protein
MKEKCFSLLRTRRKIRGYNEMILDKNNLLHKKNYRIPPSYKGVITYFLIHVNRVSSIKVKNLI